MKLSNIARSLKEEIPLLKTEDRLSRNLKADELEGPLSERLASLGSRRVEANTVLCLDLSDVHKEYAEKMEYLDRVWDGSEGEVHAGYWLLSVTGAGVEGSQITPLCQKLFSAQAKAFVSENAEILEGVDRIRAHTAGRGIWALDRGGDRKRLLEPLLERGERFVIRSTGQRSVINRRRQRVTVHHLGACCRLCYQARVIRIEDGQEKILQLRYRAEPIHLPGREEKLLLVVVAGWGQEPMILLTNLSGARDSQTLWWIVRIYLTRWKIEETFRFIKQSYRVDDIRVLRYQRLKNLVVLVTAAAYLAATFLGQKLKLKILCEKLLIISRRFFGIPPFRFYALADGIKQFWPGATPVLSPNHHRIYNLSCYLRGGRKKNEEGPAISNMCDTTCAICAICAIRNIDSPGERELESLSHRAERFENLITTLRTRLQRNVHKPAKGRRLCFSEIL